MTSAPLPKLLTMRQFCEAAELSIPMGFKLAKTGALPVIRIGAAVRIHPADAIRFFEERRGKKAAE